ncbi:MAG: hypothetical protein JNL67_20610 [Planctomycetaceae bacterium]|nr:hypothetical protein [Planctomycetaceae bacterium]
MYHIVGQSACETSGEEKIVVYATLSATGLIVWGVMGGGNASPSSARSTTRDISRTAASTPSTHSGYYSQVQTRISDLRVGMRVAAFNPEVTSTQRATFQDPDPATWRMLELEMPKASGGVLDITMLRPLEWLDAHNVVVGGSVALDMPELGAQGNARVLGVYPCPEIKSGPGQVITATFAHPTTFQILDVTIGEGDTAETIGVTETHPFWSVKQNAFVPIGQLSVGDELLTLHGQQKRLTAILPRPGPPERVYNLEVHGEHTYYVGHQQLLVHNNGCPPIGAPRWGVDNAMRAADEAAGVIVNGRYVTNPTAKNLAGLLTDSGKIGSKQMSGQFMYVVDDAGDIIIGTRAGRQRMPHPTLVGGANPQVRAAGIVDIRGGRIYSVDNASGHFKPGSGSLGAAEEAFRRLLPESAFHKDFQGFLPWNR